MDKYKTICTTIWILSLSWAAGWLFVPHMVLHAMNLKLAKAFGKGTGFGIGLIFLPVVFLPILGYGSAEYARPQ